MGWLLTAEELVNSNGCVGGFEFSNGINSNSLARSHALIDAQSRVSVRASLQLTTETR